MLQRTAVFSLLLLTSYPGVGHAQHEWQRPKPRVAKAAIEKIIGPVSTRVLPRSLNILWVWGYDLHHRPGAHDYLRVRDLMTGLLRKVPDVSVETVYSFPNEEQFERADLVVFFLHLPQLSSEQYTQFEQYIRRGGGVVALHETAIMRPASEGNKLARCLGMSWDEGRSQWGCIFEDISIENDHEIFRGFPDKLRIVDEFYWHLNALDAVKILGTVRTGPPGSSRGSVRAEKLSKVVSPVFWTLELGQGRVFGTTTGHNTFSYYDPELRIVLLRAMAWAVRVDPGPFMPLVCEGITDDEGWVGTTDDMRGWTGKRRRPPKAPEPRDVRRRPTGGR